MTNTPPRAAQLALRQTGIQSTQLPSHPRTGITARDIQRERLLAPSHQANRARIESSNTSYTIAPKSTFDPKSGLDPNARPIGASGMDAFRRMTANKLGKKRT